MTITVIPTVHFQGWLDSQSADVAEKVAIRIVRIQAGNFGDAKSVGGKVSEIRINYGPGYRVYFTRRGLEVVILLVGGDKGSQSKDVKLAQKMAAAF